MSALKGLITVMIKQLVTTLKEVTPALVTLGTQVMVFIAQVSATITAIPVLTRNYVIWLWPAIPYFSNHDHLFYVLKI